MRELTLLVGLFSLIPFRDMSPAAKNYLDKALDVIQEKSVKRETNWAEMRAKAYAAAATAKAPRDTYEAIRVALRFLGDHHSSLFTPEDLKMFGKGQRKGLGFIAIDGYVVQITPKGPADKAGLRPGMRITRVDGERFKDDKEMVNLLYGAMSKSKDDVTVAFDGGITSRIRFDVFDSYNAPECRLVDGKYGYIAVPGYQGDENLDRRFANTIQSGIKGIDKPDLRGWIVDLRLNTGGNMFPMICGLGPLIGNGDLGAFIFAGRQEHWFYRDGTVGIEKEKILSIKPYKLKRPDLPVIVLLDRYTASSGEATAISFVGLSNVIMMGGDSAGLTTANDYNKLSDGAVINLCEAVEADRTGKRYGEKMHPDIAVKSDWSLFGTPRDPVILEAIKSIERRATF